MDMLKVKNDFHSFIINDIIKKNIDMFGDFSNVNYVLLKDGKIKSGLISYVENNKVLVRIFTIANREFTISKSFYKDEFNNLKNENLIRVLKT